MLAAGRFSKNQLAARAARGRRCAARVASANRGTRCAPRSRERWRNVGHFWARRRWSGWHSNARATSGTGCGARRRATTARCRSSTSRAGIDHSVGTGSSRGSASRAPIVHASAEITADAGTRAGYATRAADAVGAGGRGTNGLGRRRLFRWAGRSETIEGEQRRHCKCEFHRTSKVKKG